MSLTVLRDALTELLTDLGAPPECMPDHQQTEEAA